MNTATKKLTDYLDAKGTKYELSEHEGEMSVSIRYGLKNLSTTVNIYISDSNRYVFIRCFDLAIVPESKMENALCACNDCNRSYKWVIFSVNSNNKIIAMCDGAFELDNCVDVTLRLIANTLSVIEVSYPKLMQAIWA